MAFDIYELEQYEDGYEEAGHETFERYATALQEIFAAAPEGKAFAEKFPDSNNYWSWALMDYGYRYLGCALTKLDTPHVRELLTDVFPRKISLAKPEDAADGIPELTAFWEFLGREYQLKNARNILRYLRTIKPEQFVEMMNDPANFGMAKSLFMMASQQGYDMTDQAQAREFIAMYNANIAPQLARGEGGLPALGPADRARTIYIGEMGDTGDNWRGPGRSAKEKRKKLMAKASRKKNRRKK